MDMQLAAKMTIDAADVEEDIKPCRSEYGSTSSHALWMLYGILEGYIKHEKAHRWLGYAQAILVCNEHLSLTDCMTINRGES